MYFTSECVLDVRAHDSEWKLNSVRAGASRVYLKGVCGIRDQRAMGPVSDLLIGAPIRIGGKGGSISGCASGGGGMENRGRGATTESLVPSRKKIRWYGWFEL